MIIFYYNGFFDEANLVGSIDSEQVRDAIVVAVCEGYPFRGKPLDLANDVIAHILKRVSSEVELSPVVFGSSGGTDRDGEYTEEVIFQVVA